jgi:hypothetical protein
MPSPSHPPTVDRSIRIFRIEVLYFAPDAGEVPTFRVHVCDHKVLSVGYVVLQPQNMKRRSGSTTTVPSIKLNPIHCPFCGTLQMEGL